MAPEPPTIDVCIAGACQKNGSDAVLVEIEELAKAVDAPCRVRESQCLGWCERAPNAAVAKGGGEEFYFNKLDSCEDSSRVVFAATGKEPVVTPQLQTRLNVAREIRKQEKAERTYRWNAALQAVRNQINLEGPRNPDREELVSMHGDLVAKTGFDDLPVIRTNTPFRGIPTTHKISNYSLWRVERIGIQSMHTVLIHLSSKDLKRGTPHPRGGGRAPPKPVTWHTTLLAEVGSNQEGPLPWIERDYTPVSTAKEWEQGKCRLLIKIYGQGRATSWLFRHVSKQTTERTMYLSQPLPTLQVPQLVHQNFAGCGFTPESVLLLLGGTGIVVLSQILAPRDPHVKLGIPVPRANQLKVPIDLIYSCREDDPLMLPQIWEHCQEGVTNATNGLRHCTVLLTQAGKTSEEVPFPDHNDRTTQGFLDKLDGLSNAQVLRGSRLTPMMLSQAVKRMPDACRIVVSGPSGFNVAMREILLDDVGIDENDITLLEA